MDPAERQFEELLLHLRDARGFDFTGYRRSSLQRRVVKRMSELRITEYGDYLGFLQVHPDEFTMLFNTMLINVTSFFRDPEAWDHLRTAVLEPMIAAKPAGAPIRVWCAGCASGEEAYTLAMVLGEILGAEQLRSRVKIYATDVDDERLAEARQATYGLQAMAAVPPELVERYFEPVDGRHQFRPELRRMIIFGRNDLVQDAPISRIDLLTCRNTLMYFTAETQARILARFHFALADGGSLFLGRAETLLNHAATFEPVDLEQRVFRKVPRAPAMSHRATPHEPLAGGLSEISGADRIRTAALLASPVAQIVLSGDNVVVMSNWQAERLCGVTAADVGRPFHDLDISYRPVELRPHIERAQAERRTVRLTDLEVDRGPARLHLEAQITPLADDGSDAVGVTLVFQDVTVARRLQDDLETAHRELAVAYEELQSTNEELETTNEELKATVEELETTNEELQSTNEELGTLNEELQSTNDELHQINDQLQLRSAELSDTRTFIEALLSHLTAAVVVVGPDLEVRVWNTEAEDLWGVRTEEAVGRHLLSLDIGLPSEPVRPLIRGALAGTADPAHEVEVKAVNRRGRTVTVRVSCSPLLDDGMPRGAIMVMQSQPV